MSSWKDLYSEVKRRKMEALDKKDVVKAVEKHGKILAIEGRYEHPRKVIDHMYAAKHITIRPRDIIKHNLSDYDVVLIGCPGDKIPHSAFFVSLAVIFCHFACCISLITPSKKG